MAGTCGSIDVTSGVATADAQTYEIDCGVEGIYPQGRKVRIQHEGIKTLAIAEIQAYGDLYAKS